MATRAEASAAYEHALKTLHEVTQMYESVREKATDPTLIPRLNQIAQSLEQARANLAVMRAKLDLMAEKRDRVYHEPSATGCAKRELRSKMGCFLTVLTIGVEERSVTRSIGET